MINFTLTGDPEKKVVVEKTSTDRMADLFWDPNDKAFTTKKPKTEPSQKENDAEVPMEEQQEESQDAGGADAAAGNGVPVPAPEVPVLQGKVRLPHNIPGLDILVGKGLNEDGGDFVWYASCRGTGALVLLDSSKKADYRVRYNLTDETRTTGEFVRTPTSTTGDTEFRVFQADDVFPLALYGKKQELSAGNPTRVRYWVSVPFRVYAWFSMCVDDGRWWMHSVSHKISKQEFELTPEQTERDLWTDLVVHNAKTQAGFQRARIGKKPIAYQATTEEGTWTTKAWIFEIERAPGAHLYHATAYLEWFLKAGDGYTKNHSKKWEDILVHLDLDVLHYLRSLSGQQKKNIHDGVEDQPDLADRPDETLISTLLYIIALLEAAVPHHKKSEEFVVHAEMAGRIFLDVFFMKRRTVIYIGRTTNHQTFAFELDKVHLKFEDAVEIVGDPTQVYVHGAKMRTADNRPAEIHLADLFMSLVKQGAFKRIKGRDRMRALLEDVARQIDWTRNWTMWGVMQFRHLPVLAGVTGRMKMRSTEMMTEIAQLSCTVPGMDSERLQRAGRVWATGMAPGAGASGMASGAHQPSYQWEGPGDDGEGNNRRPGLAARFRLRPMSTDSDWITVANLIASGRRAFPPRPRVVGYLWDEVKMAGQNIFTNLGTNPESKKSSLMPVAETRRPSM